MKKAILFGASGFIGSYLLTDLLSDPDYESVTVVVRKPLKVEHPKLRTLVGDLHTLPDLRDQINADEVFITLGTTKKNTPVPADYYRVDHDYPVLAAKIAKEKGARAVFVVTAVGANAKSNIFYVRAKGETERDIIALDFDRTDIFRPSMITGDRQEKRTLEKEMMKVWSWIDPMFVGKAQRYRGMDGKEIAQSMVNAAKTKGGKVNYYHWPEMKKLQ